jgi:hypothetical protein
LGNNDLAIKDLQKSFEFGFRDIEQLENDAALDSIRNDPRYKEILEKHAKEAGGK